MIIPPKLDGGSSVNGGELLFLALATCYCNDLYREARKREIIIESVRVEVTGEFGGICAVVYLAILVIRGTPTSSASLQFIGYIPLTKTSSVKVLDYLSVYSDDLYV